MPEELKTVEEMERYAADYAKKCGTAVTLVLDNRIRVRFDKDGSLLELLRCLRRRTRHEDRGNARDVLGRDEATQDSELADVCFACTFGRLLLQGRGGLAEGDIVGVYADEGKARQEATRLLGEAEAAGERAGRDRIVDRIMIGVGTLETRNRIVGDRSSCKGDRPGN